MPLVKSLYEPFEKITSKGMEIAVPVEKLVMMISEKVISENPGYVIRAYADEADRETLEIKIIEVLDSGSFYYRGGRQDLIDRIFDFMFGYGALQKYIEDEDISDIDGTAYSEFSITRNGVREPVSIDFGDEKTFGTYCRLVAVRNGGFLNEDDTHCRITDIKRKLRINVSIPPRNVSGPAISIRKHRNKAYMIEDLKNLGMLDDESMDILKNAAPTDQSILFCGKGAAGKTTLLRSFINSLPVLERVLVVESDAEIFPDKKFTIEQRTKKPGEGGRPVDLETLIKDGLTMSLDTYCIGEVVGPEAYSLIKASCTGHRVLGTIHSSGPEEALDRLVSLAAGGMERDSIDRVMESAVSGIDMIIYLKQFKVEKIIRISGKEDCKIHYEYLYERKCK
ncbi:MAG: ATPase, T2SS/T4P/T4SS family [Clostridia bacterium]|nr:ATPase, T2SS/T4P/T4SS family [Clostridia bacterium]